MSITRRDLMKGAATTAGVVAVGNVSVLFSASPATAGERLGPLVPDPQGLLDLPEGFRYTILSREGDPLRSGGGFVPSRFDGGAAFRGRGRLSYYVRNHELSASADYPVRAADALTYDPGAVGGTTTLVLEDDEHVVDEYVSLAGTVKNCAGGVTPWNTWLTCEETEDIAGDSSYQRDHGYVFEVDPAAPRRNLNPTPIRAMGRFQHEAVAIDPRTGEVFMTEDDSGPLGLFYRFVPNARPRGFGDYQRGGELFAMRCRHRGRLVSDLSPFQEIGSTLQVEWVRVPDPDGRDLGSVRTQFDSPGSGRTVGGPITRARKLEGMWWSQAEQLVYFVSSYARLSDGSAAEHDGQVWSYSAKRQQIRLEVCFNFNPNPLNEKPNGPDNITVTPWGGLLLAEDHDGGKHLYVADKHGHVVPFARNAISNNEMAGVCFSPDGRTLYTSIYTPGITFAITGPFQRLR